MTSGCGRSQPHWVGEVGVHRLARASDSNTIQERKLLDESSCSRFVTASGGWRLSRSSRRRKKTCFTSSPVAENLFSIFESFLSKYLSITESLWSAGCSDLGYGSRPGDLSLAPVSE